MQTEIENLREANELVSSHPNASLKASRTAAELLLNEVAGVLGAARIRENGDEKEEAKSFINRLRDNGVITLRRADTFHSIRMRGNPVVHGEIVGTPKDALNSLTDLQNLIFWFRNEVLQGKSLPSTPRTRDEYRAMQVRNGTSQRVSHKGGSRCAHPEQNGRASVRPHALSHPR